MYSPINQMRHLPPFREETPSPNTMSSVSEDREYETGNGRASSWYARRYDDVTQSTPPLDYKRSKSFHVIQNAGVGHWQQRNRRYLARTSLASPHEYRNLPQHGAPTRRRGRRVSSIQNENERLLRKNRDIWSAASNYSKAESGTSEAASGSDSSIRLEEHIKLHHLQRLLQVFKSHNPNQLGKEKDAKDRDKKVRMKAQPVTDESDVKQAPGMMTLQEFTDTISAMLGTTRWNDQMEMLFHKVDTACDGYVDWNEFCTYMLLQMREIEHLQKLNPIPFTSAAVLKQIFHNKQETTTKCIVVENPTRVLTVSKVGAIGVWDFELRLLKTYSLATDAAEDHQQGARRRFHTWVTDVVYMRNNQKVALTTSSREIYFYDVSTSIFTVEFCLFAIPNVPICAHYWYNKSSRNGHSMFFFGDDTGAAHILHFYMPQSRLFQKPFSPQQGTQRVYFNDLRDHQKYVSYECIGTIHDDVVRRIMYAPQSDVILSSSTSPNTSLVLMDVKRKKKPYIFKLNKGVECFDFSKALNILVTGSLDHLVRIWNPYVVARPITILQGHSTGICDVCINEAYGQIVTYSKDVVIKVWDIKEHHCLQTITPKFPTLQPGRIPEHGEFPMSIAPSPHDVMLVTCNDSLALLKMGKLEPKAETPTTHDAALCSAVYNSLFHQVVTASDNSVVSVWEIESGARSLTFSNAHEQEEITCISFDHTKRRLFTGARDGTIKVWNYQNGNCLHELEAVDEAEISGIMAFQDRTILAVGWSRKIALYDDSDPDIVNIPVRTNWKAGQLHKDDILSVAHCDPNLLATGSYDGCIYVWNEETQQIYVKLREGRQAGEGAQQHSPIDIMLFLGDRARQPPKNKATLISSESGFLYFWCLYGLRTLLGSFHAADRPDGSVLAVCSTSGDNYLVTGDTSGHVSVWDIEDYCATDQITEATTEKPPLCYHWRAHDGAVVGVDFIEHELQSMLVTSSVDKTARLWTLEGRLVGTFGQKKKWNLNKPATYQYPKDPWGEIVELPEPGHSQKHKVVEEEVTINNVAQVNLPNGTGETEAKDDVQRDVTNGVAPDEEKENQENEENGEMESTLSSESGDVREQEVADDSVEDADDEREENIDEDSLGELKPPNGTSSRLTGRRMTTDFRNHPNPHDRFRESRSMTIADFKVPRKGKILGDRAEQQLTRRTATRQQRRYRVGYIDKKTTSRFGNLCSPFQALAIRETDTVPSYELMPMSKRMLERGMRCRNETDLSKMALGNLVEFNDADHHRAQQKRKHHNNNGRRSTVLLPPIAAAGSSSPAGAAVVTSTGRS